MSKVAGPVAFDFSTAIAKAKAKPAKPKKVSIFLAAGVADEVLRLSAELDREAERPAERSIGDPDVSVLLLQEHNALVTEWNESEVTFTVGRTTRPTLMAQRAAMLADGFDPAQDDEEDRVLCYNLAEICSRIEDFAGNDLGKWTGKQFLELRDQIGEVAFFPLALAGIEANTPAGISAPFSLRHSPTRTSGKR